MGTTTMMGPRKAMSTRVLLVVLRRLEARKAAAAQAWAALLGDLRDPEKTRAYIIALRQRETLQALVVGAVDCMKN